MAFDFFKRTSPKAGQAVGRSGIATGSLRVENVDRNGDAETLDGKLIVQRRHVDWLEHQLRWRWLMDSLEGGDRYRNAVYGPDRRGLPCRNLFRHKREYPDAQQFPNYYQGMAGFSAQQGAYGVTSGAGPFPGELGADAAATAMDSDYELRRSRTPVPEFVAEALGIHLAKVFDQEVSREAPPDLVEWWKDVDGTGTPIDDYMRETIGPLLLVLGCIDVCLDHPKAPPGVVVKTRADEAEHGLDKVVASYIVPQNMVWWRTDAAGRYLECLVREYTDPAERKDYDKNGNAIDSEAPNEAADAWRRDYVRWRLWRSTESILFNNDGDEIIERVPHNFGRVPIVRLIDGKKHRTRAVGKSRYEPIAEIQREYYNRDSELILSDTLQAHPFLSGPEDFCKADNTLSVGPGYLLPMKWKEGAGYQGFEYVSPPKDPAESLRRNKEDLVDLKDRYACLAKPAGAGSPGTVGQSGVSKQIDAHSGHKMLTSIAKSLAKAERILGEIAIIVLRSTEGKPFKVEPADRDAIKVGYPARFELRDAADLIDGTTKLQTILAGCGNAPNTERELIQATIRQLLLGLDDDEYKMLDDEIEILVETQAQIQERIREMAPAAIRSNVAPTEGEGSEEQEGGQDPTGQSGGTMVSGVIPGIR
jgi:hypothetical protein